MGRLEAAGFDGDVLDFGTPARRSAVLLRPTADGARVEAPSDRWTAFDRPVLFPNESCGCLVLGLDDVALLRDGELPTPRLRTFARALASPSAQRAQGIVMVDGVLVWVTQEADAYALLAVLHTLLFEKTIEALVDGRLDAANALAWRLLRASVSVEEKAMAIASLERSQYPEHAQLALGIPSSLTAPERSVLEGLLFHARQGLAGALCIYGPRRAS